MLKKFLKKTKQRGFSLIELMIVVAIIGILAAVAIPNFQKFQEKARQSEAKGNLSGVFTAEQSFYGEYSSYYGEFDSIGFAPIGNLGYNVGFAALGAVPLPVGAPKGTATCFATCTAAGANSGCLAGFGVWNCAMLNAGVGLPIATGVTAVGAFQAGAIAKLNPALGAIATWDQWTLDQTNTLNNAVSGL